MTESRRGSRGSVRACWASSRRAPATRASPRRVAAAIRDPLVGELALFEEHLLADFLDDRGVLLPADELDLGRSWIGTRRELYEILDTGPDAAAQAAWVAALEDPPPLATMEADGPLPGLFELADVDATRAALTAATRPVEEDRGNFFPSRLKCRGCGWRRMRWSPAEHGDAALRVGTSTGR